MQAAFHSQPNGVRRATAGATFAGVLDAFTDDLEIAASVRRRLLTSYTGALIRVRRSSDDAEDDIGYEADGSLSEAALLAFVGAGDGFVAKVYDESGNSRDWVQAVNSKQPAIVTGGVVETGNGHPAMLFDASRSTCLAQAGSSYARAWLCSAQLLTSIDYAGLVTGGGNYILIGASPSGAMFGSSAGSYAYRVDGVDKTGSLIPFGFDWHAFTLTADSLADAWKWGSERDLPGRFFDGPAAELITYSAIPSFLADVEAVL